MRAGAELALWTLATAGHFGLTALWARRAYGPSGTRDQTFFAWALLSIGGLAIAVHVTAAAGGLSLARGVVALVCVHLVAFVALRRARGDRAETAAPAIPGAGGVDRTERRLEIAGTIVLAAIALTWIDRASTSLVISGSDASHYHVPVAVNLALGTRLLDLPPTPHLYPMASSALAAWFILPFRDALLVDLTMLLPFVLLASSVARLFRLLTGASGLAWTAWGLLLLFATPLFRAASEMSADLLFAAAFAALTTQIVALLAGHRRAIDFLIAGLATGLLLGSKTTGLPSAGLLWMLGLLLWPLVGRRPAGATAASSPTLASGVLLASAAAGLAVLAGGVWLVRNWVLWGSPVPGAPLDATTNLSIAGDALRDPGYSAGARAAHFVDRWLTAWYLPALLPIVALAIDIVASWRRPGVGEIAASRLAALVLVVGSGLPMIWLLTSAPWTSLEWTGGFSLRYVLPWLAMAPLLAWAGCFPVSWRWFTQARAATVCGVLMVAVGLIVSVLAQRTDSAPPRLTFALFVLAIGAWGAMRLGSQPRTRLAVRAALIAGLAAVWASQASSRNDVALAQAISTPAPIARPAQEVYAAARASERDDAPCEARRFFLLTRFDEPLALQPPRFENRVFYAARDVRVTARVPPLGRCDYIVTSRPVLDTDKGRALLAVLNPRGRTVEIAQAGPFVLMGSR